MSTPFHSNFDQTHPFPDAGVAIQLAGAAVPWTVPGASTISYRAEFSLNSTVDVWVSINGTAVIPVAATATTTYNQIRLLPGQALYLKGGDVLSFITSSGTPQIGVSLLQLPN